MRHASCVMRHASCLMPHASCVMRHASCVMRHASCVMRHASCVMRHESCYVVGVVASPAPGSLISTTRSPGLRLLESDSSMLRINLRILKQASYCSDCAPNRER